MSTTRVRTGAEVRRAFTRLELRLGRRLAGSLHGQEEGLRLGPGSDPEEVVLYRPGEDDVRRIDHSASARSGQTQVWRTRAEHERETWVLRDETASMDFGTADLDKRELAAWVSAAVGLLSDGPGNRVGLGRLRPDGVRWDPPLPPRRFAARQVADLVAAVPAPGPPVGSGPALAGALDLLERRHRRPGVRVVISDLVEPDGRSERPYPWERALQRLAHRHAVLVVEVVDPRDLELPDVGPLVLEDPETGHRCEVRTSDRRLREAYASLAAAHRRSTATAVRAAGAGHLVVRTDRDWVDDVARFARHQRLGPRGRR